MHTFNTHALALVCTRNASLRGVLVIAALACAVCAGHAADAETKVHSPDGRNAIVLEASDGGHVRFSVSRDGCQMIGPSPLGPVLKPSDVLGNGARVVGVRRGEIDEKFRLEWGKASSVHDRGSYAVVRLAGSAGLPWEVELRASDDGVAFRYRLLSDGAPRGFEIRDESTEFDIVGEPTVLFNTLPNFTSSHESLYQRRPLSAVPAKQLLDMPLLLVWPDGAAAAITEARVRGFAGMYLERASEASTKLRCRLSPLPSDPTTCVVGDTPHASPWRVVLLADAAGKLLESDLLLCLNDPPASDFRWVRPGKTTFPWWNGEFEDDHLAASIAEEFFERNRKYIDFCADNGIAYHGVHGDGLAWYVQTSPGYGTPGADADILTARPELDLPSVMDYARKRGVGIRLWVHWKPLSERLEEAMALYESWGVQGLMVDFLDRDDQEMIDFTDKMLACAARHQIHIQVHGSSKPSGEQRTYPNLLNREGVYNLENLKWGDQCAPDHNVNVAYTRALAGPVDYHLGGFRSASRAEFRPVGKSPVVLGTRCHHLALYVVYENPMPMVCDLPSAYTGQVGLAFLTAVPTTWDETRFLAGEPGEYVVLARRKGADWYVGGITNWTAREVEVPTKDLREGDFESTIYVDGSTKESEPNAVVQKNYKIGVGRPLRVSMAPGGGFVAILRGG